MIKRQRKKTKSRMKYAAVLLAASLTLAGCDKSMVGSEIPEENTASVPVTPQESAENPTQVPQEPNQPVDWAPVLSIETVELKLDWRDTDEGIVPWVKCRYPKIKINGEGYDIVSSTVDAWFEEKAKECEEVMQEFADLADATITEKNTDRYFVLLDADCTRMDSSVISFRMHYYEDAADDAPKSFCYGGNFNVSTGQMLELKDILTDEEGFQEKAKEYLLQYLQENYNGQILAYYEEFIQNYYFTEDAPRWCLDAGGIRFLFPPITLSSYEVDSIEVTVPYEEVTEYMEEAYCGFCGTGMAAVPLDVDMPVNLSETGVTKDTIRIGQGTASDEIYFQINGKTLETDDESEWLMSCYLIRQANGKSYLLFDTEYSEASWMTFLYEVTGGEFRKASEPVAGMIAAANANSVQLKQTIEVLGTYWPKVWFSIEETGELAQQEFLYHIEPEDYNYLTLKKDLPIDHWGSQEILYEGNSLWIIATDNEGTAWFLTLPMYQEAKSVEGEIHYTRQDGMIIIDGLSEYEYFDSIPYSG